MTWTPLIQVELCLICSGKKVNSVDKKNSTYNQHALDLIEGWQNMSEFVGLILFNLLF